MLVSITETAIIADMRHIWEDDLDREQMLWRYMPVHRFTELVQSSEIYFAAITQYADPFEGAVAVIPEHVQPDPRYSEGDPFDHAFKQLRVLNKASCWHKETVESDAMWRLYAGDHKGVAIRTTVAALESAILPFRLKPEYGPEEPYFGEVRYIDLQKERLPATTEKRFFFKHNAFSWEKEFRVIFSLRSASEFGVNIPDQGIRVSVDLSALIEAVIFGPHLSEKDKNNLINALSGANLAGRTISTSLLGSPRYY